MVNTPDVPSDDDGLPRWFTTLRSGVDVITGALNVVGTLLIIVIMLLVNSDVIGRGAFNAPVSGVPEMVSMSIVAIVFLQIAQTFRKGRLTRSEAILTFVGARAPKLRDLTEVVFAAAAAALIWIIFWASLPLFRKAWVRNTFEGTVGDFTAPIWPVKLVILIGCAALFVQIILYGLAALLRLIGRGRS
ncbi:TRAP transporter small permease subunit [Phaeobacter marinintestinus]|uniref:TRAP transporter small permease subunit n=1 Tax=Falsiphaeobacter marinintestinus TaxID=1492905 RepID=UPI0011B6399E|nr:TRAP transporter small permease subunit [Phaeobacter marinintestinus]